MLEGTVPLIFHHSGGLDTDDLERAPFVRWVKRYIATTAETEMLKDQKMMSSIVLVVEDNEDLRALTADAISLLGITVIDCSTADEALPLIESAPVTLVMTDICMPGSMDGLELAQVIWTRWPLLPTILTSGNRYVAEAMLPDNAIFLRKPWSLAALHQAIVDRLPIESRTAQ